MRRSKRDLRPQRLLPQKHRSNNSSASLNSHHGGEMEISKAEGRHKEEAGSLGPGLSTSIVHDEVLRGLMFLL